MQKERLLIFLLIICNGLFGQSFLKNPSFEDDPADATTPDEWMVCTSRSTPDILPGFWGVEHEAEDGETYVGLITRRDGSTEQITQRLRPKLVKNGCYTMNLSLAHSDNYAGYTASVKVMIWLGDKKCIRAQKIFESPIISHEEWKRYSIEFNAHQKSKYIYIEVIPSNTDSPEDGNLLIDYLQLKECIRA